MSPVLPGPVVNVLACLACYSYNNIPLKVSISVLNMCLWSLEKPSSYLAINAYMYFVTQSLVSFIDSVSGKYYCMKTTTNKHGKKETSKGEV